MYARRKEQSLRWERDKLVSPVLLKRGDLSDVSFTATWIEVAPAPSQRSHEYPSEQVYVITTGRSRMWIEEKEREVILSRPCLHPSRRRCGERMLRKRCSPTSRLAHLRWMRHLRTTAYGYGLRN
jgi:hypothetical protein